MELVIESLSKTYSNGTQALKNVTLTIPTGMFGLLGPNGAGKSTLMRIIATLQEPDSGSIRWDGLDVLKEKNAVREKLGYLPQEFGLDPKMTALDLLTHLAVLKGYTNRSSRTEAVESLLRYTNLYEVRNHRLGSFSGGMKQRFGIAQALLGNPQLIIVDEPTAGLDPEERRRFYNLLSEIGESVIVILSTHIVEDVRVLCSNMAIINAGEVILATEPSTAIDDLRNSIWEAQVDKEQIASLKEHLKCVSTKLQAGKTLIRVIADEQPGSEFRKTEPDLEDVYFVAIKGHTNGSGSAS